MLNGLQILFPRFPLKISRWKRGLLEIFPPFCFHRSQHADIEYSEAAISEIIGWRNLMKLRC